MRISVHPTRECPSAFCRHRSDTAPVAVSDPAVLCQCPRCGRLAFHRDQPLRGSVVPSGLIGGFRCVEASGEIG